MWASIRIVNRKSGEPLEAVYVGRPSPLGNPYAIGPDGTRAEVIQKYREWLLGQVDAKDGAAYQELVRLCHILFRGKGLVLSCWCVPLPCHAEVIRAILLRMVGSIRALVCGSRGYSRPQDVGVFIEALPTGTVLIEGECPNSPDVWARDAYRRSLGEDHGCEEGFVWGSPADWRGKGARAGHERNLDMMKTRPHFVAAFWDGSSTGTSDMTRIAFRARVPVGIVQADLPFPRRDQPVLAFKGPAVGLLSNFAMRPIWVDKDDPWVAPSVEHAFQAYKTEDPEFKRRILDEAAPEKAKWWGRRAPLRSDWEDIKVDVMRSLVRRKFTMWPDYRRVLLATGKSHLEEGNNWGDQFWGTVDGRGENMLGKILMEIRSELP